MGIIAMIVSSARGDTPWLPVNLIAATLVRGLQAASLETLNQFQLPWFLLGAALHVAVSTVIGLLFVTILPTLPGPAWPWSLALGILLWLGALYAILPLANPVMFRLVDKPSFVVANIVYALVLGYTVTRFHKITNPPAHPLDIDVG